MATVGQQLTSPETGWRRYDDTDSRILYKGNWTISNMSGRYNNTEHYSNNAGATIALKFYGTKIRLINMFNVDRSKIININIDGNITTFSENNDSFNNSTNYQRLVYEKTGLDLGVHTIILTLTESMYLALDSIDIDDTGYLMHPTLNQVSNVNGMQIGDCIPCRYTALTSGQPGYFSELGTCIANEIPVSGTATPDGLFYLIKTNKGTLFADRVIQTNISWDMLNAFGLIEGVTIYDSYNNECVGGTSGASSVLSGYPVNNAFDSDISNTWWASNAYQSSSSDYIYYVFNAKKSISRISLATNPDKANRVSSFKVKYLSSDDSTWLDLCTLGGLDVTTMTQLIYDFIIPTVYTKGILIAANSNTSNRWCINGLKFYSGSGVVKNIRSLSGGVAYADANGNSSLTNQSLGGWPTNNEWDKIIANSDLKGKITPGDDSIWHYTNKGSLCKDTALNGMYSLGSGTANGSNVMRTYRGYNDQYGNVKRFQFAASTTGDTLFGFRPTLNYVELDIASEVIF
jgi:hypothetical protein